MSKLKKKKINVEIEIYNIIKIQYKTIKIYDVNKNTLLSVD